MVVVVVAAAVAVLAALHATTRPVGAKVALSGGNILMDSRGAPSLTSSGTSRRWRPNLRPVIRFKFEFASLPATCLALAPALLPRAATERRGGNPQATQRRRTGGWKDDHHRPEKRLKPSEDKIWWLCLFACGGSGGAREADAANVCISRRPHRWRADNWPSSYYSTLGGFYTVVVVVVGPATVSYSAHSQFIRLGILILGAPALESCQFAAEATFLADAVRHFIVREVSLWWYIDEASFFFRKSENKPTCSPPSAVGTPNMAPTPPRASVWLDRSEGAHNNGDKIRKNNNNNNFGSYIWPTTSTVGAPGRLHGRGRLHHHRRQQSVSARTQ